MGAIINPSGVSPIRTTLALDDDLLEKAREYTGLTEKSAIVKAALVALVEREAARRLARMGGSDPQAMASTRLRSGARLLTCDGRLNAAATRLGVAESAVRR